MSKKQKASPAEVSSGVKNQNQLALALSGLAAVAYYLYSFKSTGYYQHDEIAHLMNMYEFWDKPSAILGNWPKTGYKLVYAVPALLGSKFLVILNCLFAGLSAYLAFKVTEFFDKRYALLALVLMATQPMWIELSFRNYADSFSGLVLIAGIYFHYRKNYLLAGLLLSFSTLVRQEFFLIAVPYGLYLLTRKQWLSAVLMGTFPVLYDLWGAAVTGDPLYLFTSSKATSDLYSEQFSRHGFFHFWRMSMIVWSSATVVLAVLFSSETILATVRKKLKNTFSQNPWFLLFPALVYLLIHSLFNWDALALGASPNLRYMNGIGPVLAVMGAVGLSSWEKSREDKNIHLIVLAIVMVFYALYASYEHNGVVLTEEADYSLLTLGVIGVLLLLPKLKPNQAVLAFSALALISGTLPLQAKKPSTEDEAIDKLAKWLAKKDLEGKTLFTNHSVVPYYYDKQTGHIPENLQSLDSAAIANAPVGSLVIIESHYSLRKDFPAPANSIRDQYLQDHDFQKALNSFVSLNQGNYEAANQFVAKDQRFGAIVFERIK